MIENIWRFNGKELSRARLVDSIRRAFLISDSEAIAFTYEDLSPGFAGSLVLRIIFDNAPAVLPRTLILKIPDWCEAKIVTTNALTLSKERRLFETGLLQNTPFGFRVPQIYNIGNNDGMTFIWSEDVGADLKIKWGKKETLSCAQKTALLHKHFLDNRDEILSADWLSKKEYATHSHYLQTCIANLELLDVHHLGKTFIPQADRTRLAAVLRKFNDIAHLIEDLPQTLLHGDYHIRNVGFCPNGELIVLDWANAGAGPLGGDLATFITLFQIFGGNWEGDRKEMEEELIKAYCEAIAEIDSCPNLENDIRTAIDMWYLTWGLHLHLGPGLRALLNSRIPTDSLDAAMRDIREGCDRAFEALARHCFV